MLRLSIFRGLMRSNMLNMLRTSPALQKKYFKTKYIVTSYSKITSNIKKFTNKSLKMCYSEPDLNNTI